MILLPNSGFRKSLVVLRRCILNIMLGLVTLGWLVPVFGQSIYPEQRWLEKPAGSGEAINNLLTYTFPSPRAQDRKGVRSNGLVVIQGGHLVLERYEAPYDANKPHLTWSISKSFINALYGIAEQRGQVLRTDSVGKYYRPWAQEGYNRISFQDLLHWSSGLDWAETYEASPLTSSVVAMLYTFGRDDMAAFAAGHPVTAEPGSWHNYSSGDTNILSATLRGVVGEESYHDYPWRALFDPLGMRSVTWEQDASGTYVGSSYLYATPRDMARFGYLFLRKGRWNDQILLPDDWVDFSTTLAPSYSNVAVAADDDSHPGAHWWVNSSVVEQGQPLAWPSAPADTYAAWGHWGQYIFVIPSLDLVVVRTGDDRDGSFDRNQFLGLIVKAFSAGERAQ